ncbi:MAG: tetratricopeptide repeat protein [Pseudomonadota bacterium]
MELLSEDEQWDALKRWVKTNGPSVLIMVAVALLGYFGWQWWLARQDEQARAAGVLFQKILADFDADKLDEALAGVEKLHTDYAKSAYVSSADLAAAHVYVDIGQLDKALPFLERVVNTSVDKPVQPIARLRLARVQSAQGQHDKALTTLGTEDMGPYQSAYLETRGDVLFAKGDHAGALKAYEAARALLTPDSAGPEGVGPLLELKISDLKAKT